MLSRMKKGFTLIELLVVIAILGMLAGIIVSATAQSRSKGVDGSIRSNMNQFRSQFDILALSTGNDYSTLCGGVSIGTMLANLKGVDAYATNNNVIALGTTGAGNTITCHSTTTAWAVEAPLATGFWCIDSAGKAGSSGASALSSNVSVCN